MKWMSLWSFFTDPVMQAATLGSIFMSIASSLVGALALVRKRALIGEALSHASYPGIALSIMMFATFCSSFDFLFVPIVIAGACLSSFLGLKFMHYLEDKLRVSSDSALCAVLSSFLGIGILLASKLQFSHPIWYQKIQMFLYGQAATMVMSHVWMYVIFSVCVVFFIALLFPRLKIAYFDKNYGKVLGMPVGALEKLYWGLLIIAIVIGIRSVGVVLMAGMLIAPAAAARQFTSKLSHLLIISATVGALSALLGNYLSVNLGYLLQAKLQTKIILPTGPMILVTACFIAIFSAIFAPKQGIISRIYRREKFKYACLQENVIKCVYKRGNKVSLERLKNHLHVPKWIALLSVRSLKKAELITPEGLLSKSGEKKAKKIIRYHRLWELYLHKELGFHISQVHKSAEEMEHIITKEMEEKLTKMLDDPTLDPHDQTIPQREEI